MRIVLSLAIITITLQLRAQTDTTKTQGEIISGKIIIEKDNRIIMPQADKIYVRTTPKIFENQPINVNFRINEPSFDWSDYKLDVPYRTLDESYPLDKFQNYVKFGLGNYNSPLFEAGIFQSFGGFDSRAKFFL